MHPYTIGVTGSNISYTSEQILSKSIIRYFDSDPTNDILPSANDIVNLVSQNSYIGFTPGMYFDVYFKNASSGTLNIYPGTGIIGNDISILKDGLAYVRLTLNSSSSVNATVITSFQATGGGAGTQGPQGPDNGGGTGAGTQGFQGFQGPSNGGSTGVGSQGYQGYQGLQGNQGLIGFQGYQGYQGLQGNQGLGGVQGFQGYQGLQGNVGLQGAQGLVGVQGLEGLQGV
jgi:hypothetical protein